MQTFKIDVTIIIIFMMSMETVKLYKILRFYTYLGYNKVG